LLESRQIVPSESGNVIDLALVAAESSVVVNAVPPVKVSVPSFCIVNCVVPEELAANISPLFVWLTIRAAFAPIPPDIDRGAGVFEDDPMLTPVSPSDVNVSSPVPLGVIVRFPFVVVCIVVSDPPPTLIVGLLRDKVPVVAPTLRVVAAPNALIVVAVVLNTSNEASPVRTLVVNVGDVPNTATPVPVSSDRESIKNCDVPVVATLEFASRNRAREAVRDERLIVGSDSLVISVPLSITIFPVVAPPIVRVFPRSDCIVEFVASNERPLSFPADRVAIGASVAIPVTAN